MRLDVPNVLILAAYLAMCVGWYWLSSNRRRVVGLFKMLRLVLIGNVAGARVVFVPDASNDDVATEEAKVAASSKG